MHLAGGAFTRVALYFENSILPADLELLPAAGAAVTSVEVAGAKLTSLPPGAPACRGRDQPP